MKHRRVTGVHAWHYYENKKGVRGALMATYIILFFPGGSFLFWFLVRKYLKTWESFFLYDFISCIYLFEALSPLKRACGEEKGYGLLSLSISSSVSLSLSFF